MEPITWVEPGLFLGPSLTQQLGKWLHLELDLCRVLINPHCLEPDLVTKTWSNLKAGQMDFCPRARSRAAWGRSASRGSPATGGEMSSSTGHALDTWSPAGNTSWGDSESGVQSLGRSRDRPGSCLILCFLGHHDMNLSLPPTPLLSPPPWTEGNQEPDPIFPSYMSSAVVWKVERR